jgi:uncharacterized protein
MMKIVWSHRKNRQNIHKHRVDFNEAKTIFDDPLQVSIADPDHSLHEYRFITMGRSILNRLLVIVHIFQDDKIRIISARRPTRKERQNYEEGTFNA